MHCDEEGVDIIEDLQIVGTRQEIVRRFEVWHSMANMKLFGPPQEDNEFMMGWVAFIEFWKMANCTMVGGIHRWQ